MPRVSVALSLFNARSHAWIALESLCAQKMTPDWELVIVQEEKGEGVKDFLAYHELMKYQAYLEKAGCVRIRYVPLEKRKTLYEKWLIAASNTHPDSRCFLLQAADDYSHPHRIRTTYDHFAHGTDYYCSLYGLFYHLQTGKHMLYRHYRENRSGLSIAVSTPLMKSLPSKEIPKGVDNYILSMCRHKKGSALKIYYDKEEKGYYTAGVYTDGVNTISKRRVRYYDRPVAPYCKTTISIEKTLPPDIVAKLQKYRVDNPLKSAI